MIQHNLNIVLCGIGTVGGTLLEQLASQQQMLLSERKLNMQVVGVVDIFNILTDKNGLDLSDFNISDFRTKFSKAAKSSLQLIHDEVLALDVKDLVFVDCTASYEVAELYLDFLKAGISVVCANKVAASGDLENYKLLKKTARDMDVKYNFETNVGAGLPIIHTIDALRCSGDKIVKLEAVLSGTLNYIFNTISKDITFSKAVMMAKEARFAEPDPRIDLSGIDVIRKLVILARESGLDISQDDVEKNLFVPAEYFEGSVEDFWQKLPQLDEHFEKLRQDVEAANEHLRFVAKLENGKASVSLQRISQSHPFYDLEGSNNIIQLLTERYNPHPMLIQGYGAGAGVTAAGVFADIMNIAGIN